MVDIQSISTGLQLGENGIWYGTGIENLSYPSKGYDTFYAIEEKSFWFRHRNHCIASAVRAYPPGANGTIFDIGGGNGFVSLGLSSSGFKVALVEPGKAGASNAKKRGVSDVICATISTAKFKRNSLPAVGLFDVIEHIEDDLAFLKSIRKLMQPHGRLYVTVPAYLFLWSTEDTSAGHFRRYALGGLKEMLQAAGFHVEFSSYFFRFLPIPVFLLRTLPYRLGFSKRAKAADTIARDHAVKYGILADILDAVLQSEIHNLNNRKAMRFGGSCLAVAKKPPADGYP